MKLAASVNLTKEREIFDPQKWHLRNEFLVKNKNKKIEKLLKIVFTPISTDKLL